MSPRTSDGLVVGKALWRFGNLDDLYGGRGGEGDHADAATEQAELGGGGFGYVDDPQVLRRQAVRDGHQGGAPGLLRGHENAGAEGQRIVCGGHGAFVEHIAAAGAMAV
jgi:hypothetical protein